MLPPRRVMVKITKSECEKEVDAVARVDFRIPPEIGRRRTNRVMAAVGNSFSERKAGIRQLILRAMHQSDLVVAFE